MKCKQVRDLIGPYLYGDLSPEEMRAVRLHAQDCPPCRKDLESQVRMISAMPDHAPALSDDDRQRIAWSVKGAIRRSEASRSVVLWRLVPLAGAVVVVLALVIGSRVGPKPEGGNQVAIHRPPKPTPSKSVVVKIREEPIKTAQKPKDKGEKQDQDTVRMTDTLAEAIEKAFTRGSGLAVTRDQRNTTRKSAAQPDKPAQEVTAPKDAQEPLDTENVTLPEPTKPNDARTSKSPQDH